MYIYYIYTHTYTHTPYIHIQAHTCMCIPMCISIKVICKYKHIHVHKGIYVYVLHAKPNWPHRHIRYTCFVCVCECVWGQLVLSCEFEIDMLLIFNSNSILNTKLVIYIS